MTWRRRRSKKTLPQAVEDAKYLYKMVELWTCDEHRIGLIPRLKRIWAPKGQRPIVTVQTKYEWLYLFAFVRPQTGETIWYILPECTTAAFQVVLDNFAKARAASEDTHILLVHDQAPWHMTQKLVLPTGLESVPLPPYSPELQPAERLWELSDETIVNHSFLDLDSLQRTLSKQCVALIQQPHRIKALTLFHWWPIIL
jgi:DDE superfamily endonuclease